MSECEQQLCCNILKRCLAFLSLIVVSLATPTVATADVVTDWNAITLTIAAPGNSPPQQARIASIVRGAVFDAVNAIDPHYTAYAVSPPVTQPASPEAAAVAAAYGVLVRLFPSRKADLDAAYASSLAQIADGDAKQNGIAVGEFVAAEMVALRSTDGSAAVPYTWPPPGVGIWRPTAPAPPALPWWGSVAPLILESATQFHVPRTKKNGRQS